MNSKPSKSTSLFDLPLPPAAPDNAEAMEVAPDADEQHREASQSSSADKAVLDRDDPNYDIVCALLNIPSYDPFVENVLARAAIDQLEELRETADDEWVDLRIALVQEAKSRGISLKNRGWEAELSEDLLRDKIGKTKRGRGRPRKPNLNPNLFGHRPPSKTPHLDLVEGLVRRTYFVNGEEIKSDAYACRLLVYIEVAAVHAWNNSGEILTRNEVEDHLDAGEFDRRVEALKNRVSKERSASGRPASSKTGIFDD